MRRVVVTGLGLLSPLADGVDTTWSRLLKSESAAGPITRFDASDLPVRIACEIKTKQQQEDGFDVDEYLASRDVRRNDMFINYAIAAATQAVKDAGIDDLNDDQKERTGVIIGSGIGGLDTIARTAVALHEHGPRKVSPFFIPSSLINLASGQVSIKYGFKGPNHSVVTACSTGAHAIGDAGRLIALGDADIMLAGGAEGAITRIGIVGFNACKALSTSFNEEPHKASRPYDVDRDGFVMGEGAGVLVLEEYEHAKARNAQIYGELIVYGLSGDAYHITAPSPDGDGGYRSMRSALQKAGISTSDIAYVNAHGTSTPLGDEIELSAVSRLFGADASQLAMSSTKSSIGHLLGAAGAVEAIFSLLAIRDQVAPPTINLDNQSVQTVIDLVPHEPQSRKIDVVLSNSFGFGGTNASLCFRKI
jgi:3-oxoacyl-[acyl-carrier-protein] synthase II